MRALTYAAFGGPLTVVDLPEPTAPPGGAVVRVEATGDLVAGVVVARRDDT